MSHALTDKFDLLRTLLNERNANSTGDERKAHNWKIWQADRELRTDLGPEKNFALKLCNGNCEFVHSHFPYDGSKCGCVCCPNVEFCNQWFPPEYLGCWNGWCVSCDITFTQMLEFSNPIEDCPICLERKPRCIAHPANCGHKVCIECLKEMFWPKRPEHPAYEEFGFQTLCDCCGDASSKSCDIYEQSLDDWLSGDSNGVKAYYKACDVVDQAFDDKICDRANARRCPLCRASRA
jgi:hypothetical protein